MLQIAFAAVIMTGCDKGSNSVAAGKEGEPAAGSQAKPAADAGKSSIEGTLYTCPAFSLMVPKGWEKMVTDKGTDVGVQIYKGYDMVQVGVGGLNMNETEAQQQTEATAKQYSGTPAAKEQIFGREFWKTTYTAASTFQTSYLAMKDGKMISVKVAGKDHDKNDTIKEILKTLKFN